MALKKKMKKTEEKTRKNKREKHNEKQKKTKRSFCATNFCGVKSHVFFVLPRMTAKDRECSPIRWRECTRNTLARMYAKFPGANVRECTKTPAANVRECARTCANVRDCARRCANVRECARTPVSRMCANLLGAK